MYSVLLPASISRYFRAKSTNTSFVVLMLCLLVGHQAMAQTFTNLHTFTGKSDGADPFDTLIFDNQGNLYGTTWQGGNMQCNSGLGCGTVFKIDPAGNETVVYAFTSIPDGTTPRAELIRDSAGNLYGTTSLGGASNGGTVFKIDPNGNETVLYSFTKGRDGYYPAAGLVRDSAGNLYGTTANGGNLSCSVQRELGCGVVFKLTASGKEIVLHRFGAAGSVFPFASLIRDSQGNLYGTTSTPGSVFKIDSTGKFTTIHRFCTAANDGCEPEGKLLRDSAGNLYGTTHDGGTTNNGTIFKIDKLGHETILYNFTGGSDGRSPYGNLLRDAAGNFYGTTALGGDLACNGGTGCGTIFKLSTTGAETVLHTFEGTPGKFPQAGLVMDVNGNFYGTTFGDASTNFGSVFKLVP